MKRSDRRGQSLSVNTIVIIILAVLVLAIIAVGFIVGWDKIGNYIKPSNNVKEIKDACGVACATGSKYDFCEVEREIKVEKTIVAFDIDIVNEGKFKVPDLSTGDKDSCYVYSFYSGLGIEKCASIQCPLPINFEKISAESTETAGTQ